MEIVIFLLIGATAGWIAGLIMKGGSFGLLGNMIVGVIGSFLGRFLLSQVGYTEEGGIFISLITAVGGAVVLLFFLGIIKNMLNK
jgi:uncharacterized membrane protein YeaQ/YmgE (transglycosylase-associated protein family)